ncbi:MAG TPA: vWA domain-containing protein [Thermoanaerobaculia bacterium]|jgi:hypothetical protein
MKRPLLIIVVLTLLAVPAQAARDIRVVLDLSKSMKANDPGRLAILSTILLHDLARPNTTTGDSFEVIPFDLDWHWSDPAAPPPVSAHPRIAAQSGRRSTFVTSVANLPYEAKMTYFYPGIAAALADLEGSPAGTYDTRAIVLVTDGVPEAMTRDAELRRIREELAPRLEQHRIRLYVLAFGSEAAKHRDFFSKVVSSPQGTSLGELFIDPNGTQLLAYMLQIFSRSFGYTSDAALPLGSAASLDLDAGSTPERVAVAVLSPRPNAPPALRLTAPPGGALNAPEGVQSASVPAGSYSLVWVLSPSMGAYRFASDATSGTVAILRPARLVLELLPAPPLKQVERTLAATPFPLRVLVRPASGAQGDPGHVDLSFRTFGERVRAAGGPDAYAWASDHQPPAGAGTPSPRGRIYDLVAEFREDPEKAGSVYAGHLEVEARRGEAVVGALSGTHAHRVEVHPLLALAPFPLTAYASKAALERREEACTTFSFREVAGSLPHPDRPSYPVRAVLSPRDPAALKRELRQAAFTLDGLPLELDGQPASQPSVWSKGRQLTREQLLGDHSVCVRIGKPSGSNYGRAVELDLATMLLDDPYDDFNVVKPFHLKVLVAPPALFERWRFVVLPTLLLVGLLALLWYTRDRPVVPSDLQYAIAHEAPETRLTGRELDASPAADLLGWVGESAVFAPGEDRLLGRVRPADKELFQFRPASGVRVEALRPGEETPLRRGLATLAVHRTYRLCSDRGSYLFRLEYR